MLSDAEFEQLCHCCKIATKPLPHPETVEVSSESTLTEVLQARSAQDRVALNFLAGGTYRFFTPAAVRVENRSLGSSCSLEGHPLDAQYRWQQRQLTQGLAVLTEMPECTLFAQDVCSILAMLLTRCIKPGKVLIAATVAPAIRDALRNLLKHRAIDLVVLDYDKQTGTLTPAQLRAYEESEISAVIVAWPNFFSLLEDVDRLSSWAKAHDAALIVLAEPLALSLLETPYDASEANIDFMLGDLASFGLPANRHGCGSSFLMCRETVPESMRLVAQADTLPALPQLVEYLAHLSTADGLQGIMRGRDLMQRLLSQLTEIAQVSIRFSSPQVLECVIRLEGIALDNAQRILSGHNILPGYFLGDDYPELQDCLMLFCSDLHNEADIDKFAGKIATVVKNLSTAGCPVKPKF